MKRRRGMTKDWRQRLERLRDELPGLRWDWSAGTTHLRVTRDGYPGSLLVAGTTRSRRTMLNDSARIRHKLGGPLPQLKEDA